MVALPVLPPFEDASAVALRRFMLPKVGGVVIIIGGTLEEEEEDVMMGDLALCGVVVAAKLLSCC